MAGLMMTTGKEATMAKKSTRNDKQVKIDAQIARDAQLVSIYRGVTLAEYLSEMIRPLVTKDLAEEQTKAAKAPKSKGGSK